MELDPEEDSPIYDWFYDHKGTVSDALSFYFSIFLAKISNLTLASKSTNKLSTSISLKKAERSKSKSAKQSFASK
jgi:hypothetical protein